MMFDQLVVSSAHPTKTHKSWTVALSAIVQSIILGILILIPLIYTEALPKGMLNTFLVAPAPPPPPPPPAAPVKTVRAPKIVQLNKMVAPTVIPKNVAMIKDEAPVIYTNGGGVDGGTGNGILNGIIGSGGSGPPPPPTKAPSRIRVGGNVQAASLVNKVTPQYPPIAKTAHVSGTVVLHAIIAKDGSIQELQYMSGPPLLMKSAMDAVREWRYKPTMLNGDPVEVDTTISVVFSLGG
jgi:periplasmic protein TonB